MTATPTGSKTGACRTHLLLALPLACLLAAGVASAAFPPVTGPVFPSGDPGAPGESIGNQQDVAVAAGGSGYLAVWTDMRTSLFVYDGQGNDQTGRDIFAARLDANGNLLDATPIVVNQAFGSQEEPRVGWNGQNWLVIWENQTPAVAGAPPRKIFAVRVAPDGTVLDDPPIDVLEAPEYAGAMTQMAVAASGSEWLVVGQADTGGGLLGVRVAADGTVVDNPPVQLAPDTFFLYSDVSLSVAQGEYLLVYGGSSGWEAQRFRASDLRPVGSTINLPSSEPRVASSGAGYFVTWDPIGGTLMGSRMSLNGTLLDPGGIPLMDSDYWDGDDSRVVWDGTQWWAFHGIPYPNGGLHFVRVSAAGSVIDPSPVHVFTDEVEGFVGPYHVAGGLSGGAQLTWADQGCNCPDEWAVGIDPWDIKGEHIAADAQIAPDATISRSAPAETLPDLAAGPGTFLSVFVSEVDDVQRIQARRLDPLGNALDEQPIEIASGTYVTNPAAAWNGSVYMITWDEFYYCVGGDWPPCGNFIHAVRMLPDGTLIDPEPIVVMVGNHGHVAALGEHFLVVGRDNFTFLGHEVVPLAVRVDGATGEVLDTTPIVVGWSFAVRPRVTTFMGRWLVVFERRASHDENWGGSYYNLVSADGTVEFDKFQTPAACGGATPKVAVSGTEALVVCREGAPNHFLNDINGGLILPGGGAAFGFEISGAVEQQRGPTVAFDGSDFLVAWEDMRHAVEYFDMRTDLYGARVSLGGTVLDPLGVPLATGVLPEHHPALVSAGGDTLLASSIFRDDPGLTAYRLGVFHADGTFTDPPTAALAGSPREGCSPLAVDFVDQSAGNVTSWHWEFGDGADSTEQNPSHLYTTPGIYSVTLTAGGSLGGFDTAARFDYVSSALPAQASFTATQSQVCAPLGQVAFTDTSAGFPDSWVWDFGDGTYSTKQHPTHTYSWPGSYTVTLTISGGCGEDSTTLVDLVQIDPPCDQVRLAQSDIPVVGMIISGDYTSTHVYDVDDFELFYERMLNDGAGYYSALEHRWDFDVPVGDSVTFHAQTYSFEPDDNDVFRFEYSTDGSTFVPLVNIPVGYGTLTAPLPPSVNGTVYIRLIDSDRTIGNYQTDGVSVDFMAINTFVPLPLTPCGPVTGLKFGDTTTMGWSAATGATQYDIMRGSIESLNQNASVGDASCVAPAHAALAWSDPEVPAPGTGYYYILRGQAAGRAPGTFDNPGPPPIGFEQRDEEVGSAGGYGCTETP